MPICRRRQRIPASCINRWPEWALMLAYKGIRCSCAMLVNFTPSEVNQQSDFEGDLAQCEYRERESKSLKIKK